MKIHLTPLSHDERTLDQVMEIETLCFPDPWTREEFWTYLHECGELIRGGAAWNGDHLAGFCIMEITPKKNLRLLNFAVRPCYQRKGVGKTMMTDILDGILEGKQLLVDIRERNLDGQLFLKACGLKCVSMRTTKYENVPEPELALRFESQRECVGVR